MVRKRERTAAWHRSGDWLDTFDAIVRQHNGHRLPGTRMALRRDLLRIGVAVSLLPVAIRAGAGSHGAAVAAAPLPFHKVIYDRRFQSSLLFGQHAAHLALATYPIDGDVTGIWYHDLAPHWRKQPVAIAGLTTHASLFCLEELARDAGLRVWYRGEHRPYLGGVTHQYQGPRDLLAGFDTDADWIPAVTQLMARCPERPASARHALTGRTSARPHDSVTLYSWIIGPNAPRTTS